MKWAPFQSPSIRKPTREFCTLKWNSDRLPLGTLLYGTLPKLEPIVPVAAFLSRQKGVKSIKPTGMIQTLPSRRKVGMVLSGSASQGFPAELAALAAACGTGSGVARVVTAGKGGRMGLVDAICP